MCIFSTPGKNRDPPGGPPLGDPPSQNPPRGKARVGKGPPGPPFSEGQKTGKKPDFFAPRGPGKFPGKFRPPGAPRAKIRKIRKIGPGSQNRPFSPKTPRRPQIGQNRENSRNPGKWARTLGGGEPPSQTHPPGYRARVGGLGDGSWRTLQRLSPYGRSGWESASRFFRPPHPRVALHRRWPRSGHRGSCCPGCQAVLYSVERNWIIARYIWGGERSLIAGGGTSLPYR